MPNNLHQNEHTDRVFSNRVRKTQKREDKEIDLTELKTEYVELISK